MIEERDVVIVGGGIAGLTAALQLRDLSPLVSEFVSMETAARTGVDAAATVRRALNGERAAVA